VSSARSRPRLVHWAFVLPAVVLLAGLTVYPLGYAVDLALSRYNLARPWVPGGFLGLGNFADFFSDSYLGQSLVVTAKFGLATVVVQLVIGFGVAWLLSHKLRGSSVFRIVFLVPMMVVPVVAALVWRLMLNDSYGLINWSLGQVGVPPQIWLGGDWALPSVIAATTWQLAPFAILIFSVALASIPGEYYEAAAIDGASRWDTFRMITLPNLRWSILIVFVFQLSDAIKAFDVIYALTGGGPGIATQTLAQYIYRTGFTDFEMGYTAALSFLILFISVGVLWPFLHRMNGNDRVEAI
jgi:multiple sugar transport system permease protein